MRVVLTVLASVLLVAAPAQAQDRSDVETAETEPVEIMILGSYHFANPGLDAVNIEVDDMLAPERQRELAILVDALAQWAPTHVAVERQASGPEFALANYAETEELLSTRRGEGIQIGYRLARQLGHEAVYGFDEQPEGDEPNYFPMESVMAFAGPNDQAWIIEGLLSDLQARAALEEEMLPEQSVAESLLFHNDPEQVEAMHDLLYFSLMQIGDGDAQPGAELNALWFMRNAKMFSKLMLIAEPGDRLLVIVGSGHSAWLRDLTRRTPGFELVESYPYLQAAAIASELPAD